MLIHSAAALADLDQIYQYLISHFARDAARKIITRLATASDVLRKHPQAGRLRPDFGEGIRALIIDEYVLFYLLKERRVIVLRVMHGARDLTDLDINAKEE